MVRVIHYVMPLTLVVKRRRQLLVYRFEMCWKHTQLIRENRLLKPWTIFLIGNGVCQNIVTTEFGIDLQKPSSRVTRVVKTLTVNVGF